MEVELINQRLEELNTVDVFKKKEDNEYRQLLNNLEKFGVPPQSAIINFEDRERPISTLSEIGFIPEWLVRSLDANGIKTVGHFLDLNRIDTMKLNGIGPSKWKSFYKSQKTLLSYLLTKSNDVADSSNYPEIKKYSKDELKAINNEIMDCEVHSLREGFKNGSKYSSLLAELKKRGQKRSLIFEDEEINEVTIDVLENENGRIKNNCERLGIQRLVHILDTTKDDVLNVNRLGQKAWNDIVTLKMNLLDNPHRYLENYHKYYAIRELPDTEADSPLYKKILSSLEQLADILTKRHRKYNREAYIIREFFVKGTDFDDIAEHFSKESRSPLSRERVRQITKKIQLKLMSGSENPLIDNAYFSDNMMKEVERLAEDILYCPLSYVNQQLQAPDDFDPRPIIKLLGFSILELNGNNVSYVDTPYVISDTDTKTDINTHFKALNEVMKKMALPISKDDIFSELFKSDTMTVEFNSDLLEHILTHSTWIEHDKDDNYSYPYWKLDSLDKTARIVYLKKRITTSEIIKLDRVLSGFFYKKNINPSQTKTIAKYPWVAKGARNDEWVYSPIRTSSLPSIHEATDNYAQKHIFFKFSDMVKYLKSKGYDKYADSSFRTYVLKCCVPSNDDTDLLCLESEVMNHNPSKWRSRTKYGTTNWIINSCVKLLGKQKLEIDKLKKLILALPEAKSYNTRTINNLFNSFIRNYCCSEDEYTENKLFITDEKNNLWVNQKCIDEQLVNLETVGSPNKQPDYYMWVLTEIVTQLKKADNHRLKLAQLSNICYPIIAPNANKTCFYKIIKKLPEEVERVDENGTVFLQLKPEKLTYEPSYSIPSNATDDVQNEITAPQVVEINKSSQPNLRNNIDWIIMTNDLKNELGYYNRWWDINSKKTIGPAIEDFVRFLESTDDSTLHNYVSRHIYEFLTQKLDRYDLHDHLTVISANLESLIRKVYMLNNHCQVVPQTNGLADCQALIPELQDWLNTADGSRDFAKIYFQFKRCRNLILHGVDVQMNTVNKYQSIYSFIALYIYIYTRFTQ